MITQVIQTISVPLFWAFSLPPVPMLVGYLAGRYFPLPVRAGVLILCSIATYDVCHRSFHTVGSYEIGLVAYSLCLLWGLSRRARSKGASMRDLHHFDWLAILGLVLVMELLYIQPVA